MDDHGGRSDERSLLRRIVDFPLVAMTIAVLLVIFTIMVTGAVSSLVIPPIAGLTPQMKFEILCAPLLILLYKLVVRHLGEHPRDDLRVAGSLPRLSLGLATGVLLFSAIVAIAALLGVYHLIGRGDWSDFVPELIVSAIFPAISEEMLFRGILFRWIEEFGGSWAALILTSLFFGAAHLANPNATLVAAFGIALEAGVMLGAAYILTRSLWLPMGIHAAWNFAQGEIFDIPVSGTPVHGLLAARLVGPPLLTGNGFGFEASLIAIVTATLFGLLLVALAVRNGRLVQPRWVRRRRAIAVEGVF